MDWDEAVEEARFSLGYGDGYLDSYEWQEVVEEAKEILQTQKGLDWEEEVEEFRAEAKVKHQIYLKSDRWKSIRLKCLYRDAFTCRDCKNRAQEVHHLTYAYLGNVLEESYCVSLCSSCHKKRHGIK
jgi:hypothetical protein